MCNQGCSTFATRCGRHSQPSLLNTSNQVCLTFATQSGGAPFLDAMAGPRGPRPRSTGHAGGRGGGLAGMLQAHCCRPGDPSQDPRLARALVSSCILSNFGHAFERKSGGRKKGANLKWPQLGEQASPCVETSAAERAERAASICTRILTFFARGGPPATSRAAFFHPVKGRA